MKAAVIEHFGGSKVLKYGDLPDPVAAAVVNARCLNMHRRTLQRILTRRAGLLERASGVAS
jgi:hypothetical protein